MPAPRGPKAPALGPTPSYDHNPGWGLVDAPAPDAPDDDRVPTATAALTCALTLTCFVFAAAAVVHGVRYLTAVVNRTRPIPAWIDWLTSISVLVFGIMTLIAVVVVMVSFGRWIREVRGRDFAAAGYLDPRPGWFVTIVSVTPLVNVVGAPWMLQEAAAAAPGDTAAGVRRRLALAWALVNGIALLALCYRAAAWATPSLQVDADALAVVTLSFAVSSVFAHWAVARVERIARTRDALAERPTRRLVAA